MERASFVQADETLEELGRGGLVILQKREGFRFGTDSILLADFAEIHGAARVGDFGTGSGILPILMSDNAPKAVFTAWEIQDTLADMAQRSVRLNGLEERINVLCGDACLAREQAGCGALDAVTMNPPYFRGNVASATENKRLSRHEDGTLLEALCISAGEVLRFGGHLFAVYPASGMTDLLCTMRNAGLEPKRLRTVHSKAERAPKLILVDAMKGAKPDLRVLPPLILANADGQMSEEYRRIYRIQ